jgi:hypothetical protein
VDLDFDLFHPVTSDDALHRWRKYLLRTVQYIDDELANLLSQGSSIF